MAPLAHFLPEPSSSAGIALIALGVVVTLFVVEKLFFAQPLPKGVPYIREPPGATRFSLKTRWAYLTDCVNLHKEAYGKYLEKGQAVIIPGIGFRSELLLPLSSFKWINTYDEKKLSAPHAFAEFDQVEHTLGSEVYLSDPWQGTTVKNELNPLMDHLIEVLNEEVGVSFDTYLDTPPGKWVEVNIYDVMRKFVAQANSRFTVGLPLCRDQDYLQTTLDINEQLIYTAGTGLASPGVLRPFLTRLATIPLRLNIRKLAKIVRPIYDRRLEYLKRPLADRDPDEPRDHFQIMLRYAQRERQHEFGDYQNIIKRLVTANFGSIHQSAFMMTNLLLNILSSDKEFDTVAALRSEFERVAHSGGKSPDAWTKAKLAQLVRADSAQRETLRLNNFGGRVLFRKAMVDGIVTDTGIELPRGCTFSCLSTAMMSSETKYEQARKYDPFRFSRVREQQKQAGKEAGGPPLTFVSTSLDYLPFSNGKHSCPGRFLIDYEIKIAMAYLLRNYDVELPPEYNGQRPPTVYLTEAQFPPKEARMRVRRK